MCCSQILAVITASRLHSICQLRESACSTLTGELPLIFSSLHLQQSCRRFYFWLLESLDFPVRYGFFFPPLIPIIKINKVFKLVQRGWTWHLILLQAEQFGQRIANCLLLLCCNVLYLVPPGVQIVYGLPWKICIVTAILCHATALTELLIYCGCYSQSKRLLKTNK